MHDYTALAHCLHRAGHGLSASAVHGIICGAVCAGADAGLVAAEIAAGGAAGSSEQLDEAVRELFDAVHGVLRDGGFDFQLLLPGDDTGIAGRTAAVADWSGGFVHGLLLGNARDNRGVPGDSAEILRDIIAISSAEPGGGLPGEQLKALVEIEEYLRVAVHLMYEEINPGAALRDGGEGP